VTEDVGERFNFNTAISSVMELINGMYSYRDQAKEEVNMPLVKEALNKLLALLAPFAPHITEELWHIIGNESSIHLQPWPNYDPKALLRDEITIVVQVNGKVRDKVKIVADLDRDGMIEAVMALDKVKKWVEGNEIVKTIAVPKKLVNIVVK